MSHRVVIVDGDEQVLLGLRELLGAFADIDIVGCESNAHDAQERVLQLEPDAVVMEVALPDRDGLELCWILRRACPTMTIVLHTAVPVLEDEFQRFGADAIVRKGYSAPRMIAAWIYRNAARSPMPSAASLLHDEKGH